MTFEEFFKRKKIDLLQLQSAEPALYSEFKHHYEQMGEKSFDHTKKYWFNQLRRRFVPASEIKVEKVIIENQLAEQTIAEALTEPATPPPSVGFKPRFKAAVPPKPAEETNEESPTEEKPAEAPKPAVGFKPRFNAAMVAKPAEEKAAGEQSVPAEDKPAETEAPKPAVGFKPRFKASMVAKPAEEKTEEAPIAEQPAEPEAPKSAVGFKPRFKASMVAKPAEPKPEEIKEAEPTIAAENKPAEPEEKKEPVEEQPAAEEKPKSMGFKPRFNAAKITKPKEQGEE